jgi:2-oxoglutarate ferredoxin oxidoreductase subunit alpha
VAQAHLRHLNPLPANTEAVLRRYAKVVVPEMNLGQLAFLLQGRFCVPVESITKVAGLPFGAGELADLLLPFVTHEEEVSA